jgi:hypothetical protein
MISSSIAGMCIQFKILTFYSRSEKQQKECLHLKKSVISLPAAIAIMDKSNRQINFNSLKKSTTSLSAAIGALGSPLGPHPESDLVTDLYSVSTPIANMERFGCQISFNSLNKFVISLSAVIGALGSPLGPHPKSDL